MKVSAKNKKAQLADDTSYPHHATANTACSGPTRPSDTLPLATLRVRCPQMRHLNLGRDSKYTGRIWRGIWLRVFFCSQAESTPAQSQRKLSGRKTEIPI